MKKYFEATDKCIESHLLAIPLIDLARSRGVHSDKLLKGTRLFYQDIISKNHLVSHQQLEKIIRNSLKLVPQKDLAFLLGRRFYLGNLGLVSKALLNAHSLCEMIRIATCFQQVIMPHMFFNVRAHGQKVHLIFNHSFGESSPEVAQFWAEFLSTALIGCFKSRQQTLPNVTFRFPFKQPEYYEQYQSHISCPCYYEQPLLMVTLDEHYFLQTQEVSSKTIKWHAINQLKDMTRKDKGLIQYIFEKLNNKGHLSLQALAGDLNLSQATLKRKLNQHNTSYSQLTDRVKHQQAVFQIIEQKKSNEQVASNLSYTDLSNFRRSFKRWTGMTPSECRNQHC
jgi:AraC-like DNA-binding protein